MGHKLPTWASPSVCNSEHCCLFLLEWFLNCITVFLCPSFLTAEFYTSSNKNIPDAWLHFYWYVERENSFVLLVLSFVCEGNLIQGIYYIRGCLSCCFTYSGLSFKDWVWFYSPSLTEMLSLEAVLLTFSCSASVEISEICLAVDKLCSNSLFSKGRLAGLLAPSNIKWTFYYSAAMQGNRSMLAS